MPCICLGIMNNQPILTPKTTSTPTERSTPVRSTLHDGGKGGSTTDNTDNTDNTGVIAGTVGGIAVLVAIIFVVLLIVKMKRKRDKKDDRMTSEIVENAANDNNDNVVQNNDQQSTTDDYSYAYDHNMQHGPTSNGGQEYDIPELEPDSDKDHGSGSLEKRVPRNPMHSPPTRNSNHGNNVVLVGSDSDIMVQTNGQRLPAVDYSYAYDHNLLHGPTSNGGPKYNIPPELECDSNGEHGSGILEGRDSAGSTNLPSTGNLRHENDVALDGSAGDVNKTSQNEGIYQQLNQDGRQCKYGDYQPLNPYVDMSMNLTDLNELPKTCA